MHLLGTRDQPSTPLCINYVQVLIPVSGSKTAGHLRSNATFRNHKWELDSVVLEFKGRTFKLTIVDSSKD